MSSTSNEVLLAAIVELKEQVAKMAEALQSREDRRMYQANYYKKRKETKKKKAEDLANARLPNTRSSHFNGLRKTNVPVGRQDEAVWARGAQIGLQKAWRSS